MHHYDSFERVLSFKVYGKDLDVRAFKHVDNKIYDHNIMNFQWSEEMECHNT